MYPYQQDAVGLRSNGKDTVLVRTGETTDILLDVTPGRGMAHRHPADAMRAG